MLATIGFTKLSTTGFQYGSLTVIELRFHYSHRTTVDAA